MMEVPHLPQGIHFKCSSIKNWYRKSLQRGLYLSQIVKIVFPPNPLVACVSAVSLRSDVFYIRTITVVEFAFKKLYLRSNKKRKNKKAAALKILFPDLSFFPLLELFVKFKFLSVLSSSDTCLNTHGRKTPLVKLQALRHCCVLPQTQKEGDPAGLPCLAERMTISLLRKRYYIHPSTQNQEGSWEFVSSFPYPQAGLADAVLFIREVCSSNPENLPVSRC